MVNYLSVSEYAKLHSKDPGNIRRLLINGRLEGQKVGNQWIIKIGTAYPKDKRIVNGNYINARKKHFLNIHKDLRSTITNMISELKAIYGNLLLEIVLYGSYARGEETSDSDVDIALILRQKPPKAMNDMMINAVSTLELECGKVLSVIDIDFEMYSQLKDILPFYKNIRREGIVLWKSST